MRDTEQPPTSRRERRRVEIRDRIVAAAYALFQERGYQAATVAQICDQADVAYKTFFNHFPSKLEVLLALEERALESTVSHFESALALEVDTRERIAHAFRALAADAVGEGPTHPELLAELIHGAHLGGDEANQVRRIARAIERLIEAGVALGDVRGDIPVDVLADAVRGHFYVLMISFANVPGYPIAERADALAGLVAETLEGPALGAQRGD